MELKDYIRKSLADIVEGVQQASEELNGKVAVCHLTQESYNGYPSVSTKYELRKYELPLTVVGFKVAVQVDEELSADGSAKAGVLNVIGGKVEAGMSQSSSTLNELTFSVPLAWVKGK